MSIFYNNVVLNGYDQHGGLCFSALFTGDETTLAQTLKEAYTRPGIVSINIESTVYNTSFYDENNYEVPNVSHS